MPRPSSTVLLTVSSGAQKGPIPDVSNKSLADAQAALKAAGFTPGTVTNEFSKTVAQGQVTRWRGNDPSRQRGGAMPELRGLVSTAAPPLYIVPSFTTIST